MRILKPICCIFNLHSEGPDAGHRDDNDDAEDEAGPQDPLVIRAELPGHVSHIQDSFPEINRTNLAQRLSSSFCSFFSCSSVELNSLAVLMK